jgi:dCTP diphosphatase
VGDKLSPTIPTLENLIELIRDFVRERDWEQFNRPLTLAISAQIEMGELLELFQWKTENEIHDSLKNKKYRERIGEELSDVLVYLLRIADTSGVNLSEALLKKMEKNREKYPIEKWKGKAPRKLD